MKGMVISMKIKNNIFFLGFIIVGVIILILAVFVFPMSSPTIISGWTIVLGLSVILLGIGNLIGSKFEQQEPTDLKATNDTKILSDHPLQIRERAGYMVCKIMNLLLCTYVLILSAIHVAFPILLMAIALLLLQFILDIVLQTHYSNKS